MGTKIVVGLAALVLAIGGAGLYSSLSPESSKKQVEEKTYRTVLITDEEPDEALVVKKPRPCVSEARLQLEESGPGPRTTPIVYCKDKEGRELACAMHRGNTPYTICYTLE